MVCMASNMTLAHGKNTKVDQPILFWKSVGHIVKLFAGKGFGETLLHPIRMLVFMKIKELACKKRDGMC